jgi:hypothetical protein
MLTATQHRHFDRTVHILAAAYELEPLDVEHDLATMRLWAGSRVDFVTWLLGRYPWDGSTCLYYLAALQRAARGLTPYS